MLCANKISVIYFCSNYVNILPENIHFFIFWGATDSNLALER